MGDILGRMGIAALKFAAGSLAALFINDTLVRPAGKDFVDNTKQAYNKAKNELKSE